MNEEWRVLNSGFHNAFTNMAIDEAILREVSEGKVPPTVRFYSWKPRAISLGYFQSLHEEVDLEQCQRHGVDVVRRITGGGAVFHDQELTYSIVVSESHREIPKNIMKSYQRICGAVIKGLRHLDIKGVYAPINDILVDGRKISGNAQTRKQGTVLQHGTILMDVDVDTMFSLLKVPNEKLKDKLITDVKQRVTSLQHILGKPIPYEQVASAMKDGFEEEFDVSLVEGTLTENELILAHEIERKRFSQPAWNQKK